MGYFDDIHFVFGDVVPRCQARLDYQPPTYSLEFMSAGRMTLGKNHSGSTVVTEPTAFWHHPRHTYQYGAIDDVGWFHHYVLFQGPRAKRLVEKALEPLSPNAFMPVLQPKIFAATIRQLITLVRTSPHSHQPQKVALLEQLVAMLIDAPTAVAPTLPTIHADALNRCAQLIDRHPERPWNADAVARQLHLSASHFRRLFQQLHCESFHRHVLNARIRRAADRLHSGTDSVERIARSVGIDDVPQFSKLFRRRMGLSPSQYRLTLLPFRPTRQGPPAKV